MKFNNEHGRKIPYTLKSRGNNMFRSDLNNCPTKISNTAMGTIRSVVGVLNPLREATVFLIKLIIDLKCNNSISRISSRLILTDVEQVLLKYEIKLT